jgi:cellulose synthase/poly-beta-1,6-N-acetylglucosamine synthase-like glycosyltransferase
MRGLDIIIPVKDEAGNIKEITRRLDFSLKRAGIKYCMIFVDDNSTDSTVKEITYASRMYPIRLIHKRGKPGKAYSILEGIKASSKQIIAMIDGDLQYSPEYLPEMFHLMKEHGVVVANRKMNGSSSLRKIGSKVNSLIFGKILFGFGFDTQSGLKMFRRDIFRHIKESDVTAWTIDMPLLHTAVELGYSIGCVDIEFLERKNGYSKIHYAKAAYEIAKGSVKLKLKRKRVYPIKSSRGPALGAGVIYKGKRYVTHTHLPHHQSALLTLKLWQKVALVLGLSTFILGLLINAKITVIVFIAILTFIYFADLIFSTYVLLKSLHFPPEIKVTDEEIAKLKEKNLPIYTILCPLYKEARVVPEFIEFISKIDWPKDKLDIILLLEEDDEETRKAVDWLGYFSYIRTLIVPASQPKTKPKACNFGLAHARGEYVVVYDAEDHPDPLQLKKAYIAFGRTSSKVVCLQSKLNYYNTDTNLLTKLFTAEYSLWFDIILPGFQSIETSVPLGGTSNHFRTKDLKGLHGWDAFNVTEDCDLGVRLFKAGYKTAIIDSTTLEEANSNIKNWLRQRSRWIKGYLQTYFVHMRSPISFVKEHGIHAFIFQLVIGMRMSFIVINPILWLTTISYFALYRFVGPAIESVYPAPVFYMAVTCLIVGNFMYLYNYMIACAKKEQWSVIKFVFLVPFYWLMTSFAAGIAFYQLIAKPHYWEKTHHGLHLKVQEKPIKAKRLTLAGVGLSFIQIKFSSLSAKMAIFQENLTLLVSKLFHIKHTIFTNLSPIYQKILYKARILVRHKFAGAGILVISSFFENFFNFLYNAYLGRALRVEDFGLISLFGSFLFIVKIPSSAIARTVTYETAYYFGKYKNAVKDFWVYVRRRSVLYSSILSLLWLVSIPFLKNFFHSDSTLPFILFTPVWFIGIVSSVDLGFVSGNLMIIFLYFCHYWAD